MLENIPDEGKGLAQGQTEGMWVYSGILLVSCRWGTGHMLNVVRDRPRKTIWDEAVGPCA